MRRTAIMAALLLGACGGGDSGGSTAGGTGAAPTPTPTPTPTPSPSATTRPTPTPVASIEREVAPATVDARATGSSDANVVINPGSGVASKGRLFLFLPGTGGPARAYRLILRTGAARGYHAIGLSYPNDVAVNDLCPPSPDPDCAGNVRREIILGEDRTTLVTVDAPSSIVGRVTALLAYLARTAPAEGWDQYLVGGVPDWSKITVAGHSQGSGHAGYLGKLYALNGVAMFSGPGDGGLGGRGLATWLALPQVTAAARLYGFIHRSDELVPAALAQAEWNALGMGGFGAAAEVDGRSAYAGPSHELLTGVAPNPAGASPSGAPFHGAPVVDFVTPLDPGGGPQFASVWTYMAFP